MRYILWEYRYIIIFLLGAILYLAFEWQRAKTILYALMLQAKSMAKDYILKSGQEQENWVVNKAMIYLPLPVRSVLNENIIRKIVRWLFHTAKDYIDDGKIDSSV